MNPQEPFGNTLPVLYEYKCYFAQETDYLRRAQRVFFYNLKERQRITEKVKREREESTWIDDSVLLGHESMRR